MKQLRALSLVLASGLVLAGGLTAQMPKPEDVVEVRAEPMRLVSKRGGTSAVTLFATVRTGFHINSNKPAEEYLIPTRIELAEGVPFVLADARFPAGELKSFGFAPDDKLSVYEGTVKVPLKLRAQPDAPAGSHTLKLLFHYQACNDQICLRAARKEVALTVRVE